MKMHGLTNPKLANIAVDQAIECGVIIASHFMTVSTKIITVVFAIGLQDSHRLHLVGWDAMKVSCVEFVRVCSETLQALYWPYSLTCLDSSSKLAIRLTPLRRLGFEMQYSCPRKRTQSSQTVI